MDHVAHGVKRKRRSAISQGRLRTSVLRQPPALTFDSAALDPWDGRAAWVARFDFPVFQNNRSAGQLSNLRRWYKTGVQAPIVQILGNALGVPRIALAPLQGLDLRWIHQQQSESVFLQYVP